MCKKSKAYGVCSEGSGEISESQVLTYSAYTAKAISGGSEFSVISGKYAADGKNKSAVSGVSVKAVLLIPIRRILWSVAELYEQTEPKVMIMSTSPQILPPLTGCYAMSLRAQQSHALTKNDRGCSGRSKLRTERVVKACLR